MSSRCTTGSGLCSASFYRPWKAGLRAEFGQDPGGLGRGEKESQQRSSRGGLSKGTEAPCLSWVSHARHGLLSPHSPARPLAAPSSAQCQVGEGSTLLSFPFPPDGGKPLSKWQAGPEARATGGHVGDHVLWRLLKERRPVAGATDTPPQSPVSPICRARPTPGRGKAAEGWVWPLGVASGNFVETLGR